MQSGRGTERSEYSDCHHGLENENNLECHVEAKICSVQPKIYNSSCEEKESKLAGIAGFYSDETSEETDPRPGYIKNPHLIKGYRSSIIEAVKPRRIKAEGRLAEALQRLVTGKRKVNGKGGKIQYTRKKRSVQGEYERYAEKNTSYKNDGKTCFSKVIKCPVSCCK